MCKLLKYWRFFVGFLRSIMFNFCKLPLKQAVYIPILLSHKTHIECRHAKFTINSGNLKTGLVKIGFGTTQVSDFKKERTIFNVHGNVIFNGKCKIGSGSRVFVANNATLAFGNNFNITSNGNIICNKSITFGNDNLISWHCTIMDSDQHDILDNQGNKINNDKAVTFGDNVWCGCHVIAMKGCTIANNVVVGAGSCLRGVYKDSNVIVSGNPAVVTKRNVMWKE